MAKTAAATRAHFLTDATISIDNWQAFNICLTLWAQVSKRSTERLLYFGPQREAMPNRAITIMQLLGLMNRVITVSIVPHYHRPNYGAYRLRYYYATYPPAG